MINFPTEKQGNDVPHQQALERNTGIPRTLTDYKYDKASIELQKLLAEVEYASR